MLPSLHTPEEKRAIAAAIKPITPEDVEREMAQLKNIGTRACDTNSRTLTGNSVVDYFTFLERLETRGKYNLNFFEFLSNLDTFKQKKYIQTMLQYYSSVKNKRGQKHEYKVLKEVYNICISAINIMRPLTCMEIFTRYGSRRVLNFCAGWGGSAVAAAALDLDAHYGVEINTRLREPYANLTVFLGSRSNTEFHWSFQDAAKADYAALGWIYDTVFVSPPYYFVEKYPENVDYVSKEDMNVRFYIPAFQRSYDSLQPGGAFIVNVCRAVYDSVLFPMFGQPAEIVPMKKSKRQNDHIEYMYVWRKPCAIVPAPLPIIHNQRRTKKSN